MAAEDEIYLENLAEYVLEEDKIVTYKWLSRTLSVHVNVAKQMLFAFVDQQRTSNGTSTTDLHVTYMIGGRASGSGNSKNIKYMLVDEESLEAKKKEFNPITCVHVYSVQKSKPKSTSVLYLADFELKKENLREHNRFSSLQCEAAKPLEHRSRRGSEGNGLVTSIKPAIVNGNHEPKLKSKVKYDEKQENESSVQKPKHGQPSTMDMFKSKAASSKKSAADSSKNEEVVKKTSLKTGGMSSFFPKQSSTSAASATSSSSKSKSESKDTKSAEKTIEHKEDKTKSSDAAPPSKKSKTENSSHKNTNKKEERVSSSTDTSTSSSKGPGKKSALGKDSKGENTKSKKIKKKPVLKESDSEDEKPVKKKRKRTKEFAEESSEEEKGNSSSREDEECPVPGHLQDAGKITESESSASCASIPPHQPAGPRRRRKRVLKSKVYMNDEGFMVTEKVWESESTDASDEEEKPVKAQAPVEKTKPEAKKSAPGKSKQASLTSFFKRS